MFSSPGVNLYTRDMERALEFYLRVGFVETFRTPKSGVPDHVEVRLDGLILGIAREEAANRDHGLNLDLSLPGAGMEIVLWTNDCDSAYAKLLECGAQSLSAPHDFLGMLRAAWVKGPDENPIQVVQKTRG